VKARVVSEADELAVVVADVIRAARVENEALLVVATTGLAQDVSRELHCSEAECVKCSLDVRLFVGDDGDVGGACRRLSLLGVLCSPLLRSLIGKCEITIIAGSDMCVFAVYAVSS
jgi:hypothetical protein